MKKLSRATLAGGCFWCTEAIFKRLRGVEKTETGYAIGEDEKEYAEVVDISFDEEILPYETLLEVFWELHDPTSLNKQNNDVGPEYRSAIFTHSDEQQEIAEKSMKEAQKNYEKEIVTIITPLDDYKQAEEFHQDYYDSNRDAPYCNIIISPKIKKLTGKYFNLLKKN